MSSAHPAPDAPLENRTLREQVIDHLREEILSSRLEPGTELSEVALARSLGISRGPLREALGQLSAEGLVTTVPRRGAVVTRLTRREFLDAYQVREALESLALRLAVPRLDGAQKGRLHELCEAMEHEARAGNAARFFELNREFHSLFVGASGNRKLEAFHAQLIAQMTGLLSKSAQLRGGLEESAAEHRKILAAIDSGDAELAARLLEEHIEVPQRVLLHSAAQGLFEEDDTDQPQEEEWQADG
ncbi:MAG TPA: GntR family transcriptional regulator [Solirubrobacteraceae bacterium]|nr:GntR family transcriptional regulator [Solirubrobacteraceae bacterium]